MAAKNDDFLNGYEEIGAYLGVSDRSAEAMMDAEPSFPRFKIGRRVCALKSRIDAWLSDRSAQAAVEGSATSSDVE